VSHLLLAAVATALAGAYVLLRRRASACTPTLADTAHFSLDWLTAHDLSPLVGGGREAPQVPGWQTVAVEGLSAAEDLLDALEAAGFEEMELRVRGDSEFIVRWR
jgi:hypothetical protein